MKGPSSRALVIGCALALPITGAVLACTAGDEIVYPSASVTADGGAADGAVDTGRVVGDSTADVPERPGDGAVLPSMAAPIACAGLAASCDPTAGMGCCLRNLAGNIGADNLCFEQVQAFTGPSCKDPGDVFLACLTSDADSTCCWHTEANGTANTRYRASCAGGVEACDPSAAGGACTTGGPCNAVICKGVVVGYCGGGTPPCQP